MVCILKQMCWRMCSWSLKAIHQHISKFEALLKTLSKSFKTPTFCKKILSLITLIYNKKYLFYRKKTWECIAKVFRKLYVKYKSNAMDSYGDITILKNFSQKCDRRTHTCEVLCPHHYRWLTKMAFDGVANLCFWAPIPIFIT